MKIGAVSLHSRNGLDTEADRTIYALHGRKLAPRPCTVVPAAAHVAWQIREVFKGEPLTA